MANTSLTTVQFRVDGAALAASEFQSGSVYGFMGYPVGTTPTPTANSDVESEGYNLARNMIAGKRLPSTNVIQAVRAVPWVANTVYDMYDDTVDLTNLDYYAYVNEGSLLHCYKVLDNNLNVPSTVQPTFSDISGANVALYQTSDGYRWKYMYSWTSAQDNLFSTGNNVPIVPNTSVIEAAIPGSIDVVLINGQGRGYNNYLTGSLQSTDIQVGGDNLTYRISNVASVVTGFYTGCLFYITSGAALGKYSMVSDYFSNSSGNFLTLSNPLSVTPTNGSQYELYPTVTVTGDGNENTEVVARALVNSISGNSVYRVEVIVPGEGFGAAYANVIANSAVNVITTANVRPIISPIGGHGANPTQELQATYVITALQFSNSELGTIPTTSQYSQVGLIRNPIWNNIQVNFSTVAGNFIVGEPILGIAKFRVISAANVSTTNAIVTSQTTFDNFNETFSANQAVLVGSSDQSKYQYSIVNNVINSTAMNFTSNSKFSNTNAVIYYASNLDSATVFGIASNNSILVTNATAGFGTGETLVGTVSGALGVISNIQISGSVKTTNTFVNMWKYTGTLNFGTFTNGETVVLGNNTAVLHSVVQNSGLATMYTVQQFGTFSVGTTVKGRSSSASFTINQVSPPEISTESLRPLYIENITPIVRSSTQSELFRITLAC